MKIKDISSIEDVVFFLNSGHFAKWNFLSSNTFSQIFTWKRETVCATISLAKPLDEINLWRFEVSAASLGDWLFSSVSDRRYYSFESTIKEDSKFQKYFVKWQDRATKYYLQDKRAWESGNRLQEQQEKFAELVKQKYPGTEGAFYYEGDYKYGEQYFEHPKVGTFEVNKDLEVINITAYGEEARKAFRFLAYGETAECRDE